MLKSAVRPTPPAGAARVHFVGSLQFPEPSTYQMPLAVVNGVMMVSIANAFAPAASVTQTVKLFVPPSVGPGVPESVPSAATFNHAGPLALLKVSVSPGFGSVAVPARLPL